MSKAKITVFKVGGNVIDDPDLLDDFLISFANYSGRKILIHGGGKKLTQLSNQMGRDVKMIDGRRVTDKDALELALMVYSGLINTNLVSKLQALGCDAIGLSGADGNVVRAKKRLATPIDFGYVGDVIAVNDKTLAKLIEQGLVPVLCALTHDGSGQMLNTNADTIAAEVSAALVASYEVQLIYLFEHAGLLRELSDPDSVIENIDQIGYEKAKEEGIIAAGMIPKMDNAFFALKRGVKQVQIGSSRNLKTSLEISTSLTL